MGLFQTLLISPIQISWYPRIRLGIYSQNKQNGGALDVVTTANQDTISAPHLVPIIAIDAWEHAYYLQYQNVKLDYFKAIWNVINWAEAESRYSA